MKKFILKIGDWVLMKIPSWVVPTIVIFLMLLGSSNNLVAGTIVLIGIFLLIGYLGLIIYTINHKIKESKRKQQEALNELSRQLHQLRRFNFEQYEQETKQLPTPDEIKKYIDDNERTEKYNIW